MPFLPPNQQRQSTEGKLDIFTVGSKFTRPSCDSRKQLDSASRYAAPAAINRAGAQQQTRRTSLLLSIDGTDRQTGGRTVNHIVEFSQK